MTIADARIFCWHLLSILNHLSILTMITTTSLFHKYNNQKNLVFPDWNIQNGERWLLLGASGSGKTTLLHMLTGILKPMTGEVMINDTSLYQLSMRKLDQFRGKNIGVIFQRPHLIKSLTVKENLLIAQTFAGLPKDIVRIKQVLASLDIEDKIDSYPGELSTGQLQRASIARGVINQPVLLVADEPTSNLDDQNTEAVLQLLLNQSVINRATLIVATHDKRVKDQFSKQYLL